MTHTVTIVEKYKDGRLKSYVRKFPFKWMLSIYVWWVSEYIDDEYCESQEIIDVTIEI